MISTPPPSPSSPRTIDDLHRLVLKEHNAVGRARMGERTLAVLADMLSRPGQAAVQSISELAAHNGVDPSTLTRLGKRLGFSGFGPLQDIFRQHVSATQPFYSTRVQDLLSERNAGGLIGALQKLAQDECQKVLAVASSLEEEQIGRAVQQLRQADHVYVLGLRGTYAVSHFFGMFLGTLRKGVTLMGSPGFPIASELSHIGQNDLLVAISFRPYTRAVVKAVELIQAHGTQVLSLTDSGSAISVDAPQGTTITIDQPFYFDSSLAHFYAAAAVLLALARELGPEAVAMIERREAFNRALNIEIS